MLTALAAAAAAALSGSASAYAQHQRPVAKLNVTGSGAGYVQHTMNVAAWKCGGPSTALIYQPTSGDGPWPLISFAHGFTAGGTSVGPDYGPKLLGPLAAAGYVVVATQDAPLNYCEWETADQISALGLDIPNVDHAQPSGIAGHSMGGHATELSSSNSKAISVHNIAAAVALHPVSFPFSQPKIPIFFGTGSKDTIVPPAGPVEMYKMTKQSGKVLAEIRGATHFEPNTIGPNRWTPFVVDMFDCHIKHQSDSCDKMYGTGAGALCSGEIPMTTCQSVSPSVLWE